ncbi:MAG: peptidase M48 Ste24p [Alphaproteobacteria bacterium]|nr:MAG: peptidase M48 Ste24p [Caulobacteraceae bacterium]TPW05644.1 MAG: peptidase M48 Ste24p [Alphaproteobacteria bacterium]
MTALEGRFHDGVTAAEHRVAVTIVEDGLEIAGAGARAFWRKQDVVVVDKSGDVWRLSSSETPDARLAIEKSKAAETALRDGGILDPRRDAIRGLWLAGGLLALSASLAFIVFVAIPLGAEPLARATPRDVEEQLGENLARQVNVFMRPCEKTAPADAAIMPLLNDLEAAGDPGFTIMLTFVQEDTPNALAVAGGQIMVTSGLLETLESPDELAAVIAHEIGHVKSRDGMIALYRNAGLGILLELITGGSGVAQQIVMVGGQLTELSYTRAQEARADRVAIAIMGDAGLDPAALARAFERLKGYKRGDGDEPRVPKQMRDMHVPEWLQSHPDIDNRIVRARAAQRPARAIAMSPEDWATVRAACKAK